MSTISNTYILIIYIRLSFIKYILMQFFLQVKFCQKNSDHFRVTELRPSGGSVASSRESHQYSFSLKPFRNEITYIDEVIRRL